MRNIAWLSVVLVVAAGCSSNDSLETPEWTSVSESRAANVEGTEPVLRLYDVRDLVDRSDEAALERFITELKAAVRPDSWSDPGAAMVRAQTGALVVKQSPAVHRELSDFLTNLRQQAMASR